MRLLHAGETHIQIRLSQKEAETLSMLAAMGYSNAGDQAGLGDLQTITALREWAMGRKLDTLESVNHETGVAQ
ncbi:MAG: hypothetical protein OXC91_02660 [Rhodobacteraceae bacterium]|nr:hypothetical protein [Paracoccaceae bacterium]